jgi:hypothetical protein
VEYLVIVWLLFGVAAGMVASTRGRSGWGWAILGCLFGPFGLVVALLPTAEEEEMNLAVAVGTTSLYRKCPYCAEAVRKEAVKCRHCCTELKPATERWRRCPHCDKKILPEADKCRYCGSDIDPAAGDLDAKRST